jgi:MHS family proline/betaine transporter-like MFS transporter
MAYEYAWPTSTSLEVEARRMHAEPDGVRAGDAAAAAAVSIFPLAFDTVVMGVVCAYVLPQVLFQALSPTGALLAGLAVFGLAWMAKLLGARVFSALRRRYGGGVSLTAARVLLGGATAAVAVLPLGPNASAIAMILGLRFAQGLAFGGTLDVSAVLRQADRSAWLGPMRLAQGGAFVMAALVAAGLAVAATGLEARDLLDWAWRYPFVLAVPLNVAALFADLRLLTTEFHPSRARLRLVD